LKRRISIWVEPYQKISPGMLTATAIKMAKQIPKLWKVTMTRRIPFWVLIPKK
jgi:hypothetical protein